MGMSDHPTMPASQAFSLIGHREIAVIDVRSQAEYEKAHFSNSVNIPILTDEHRHEVGLTYKTQGSEAAKRLGHQLVSGGYKAEMIRRWCDSIRSHPQRPALIFCWRGGLRSRLAQDWVYQNGCEAIRIEGGYKALRQEALGILEHPRPFIVLAGMTGSGKTRLLHQLRNPVDLEGLARHRGSAFGLNVGVSQPQQATFENMLAQALSAASDNCVLEDESPNIGRCHLPDPIYAEMAKAPMVRIEMPVRLRALEIYREYIQAPLACGAPLHELENRFLHNMEKIRNSLGGLECDRIKNLMKTAFASTTGEEDATAVHLDWIERLLANYYDKRYLYASSLKSRPALFTGPWQDCLDFLLKLQKE